MKEVLDCRRITNAIEYIMSEDIFPQKNHIFKNYIFSRYLIICNIFIVEMSRLIDLRWGGIEEGEMADFLPKHQEV